MKHKNNIFILLITLVGSAQAISFRDYYHGNEALGILPHGKEVNAAVATGKLDLSDKGLTDLIGFDEIPDLNTLQELHLAHNELVALPENIFHGLIQLRSLRLNNNDLITLPVNIFRGLTSLQWLYLDNNQLIELPENIFGGLTVLEGLNLSDNQLTSFPDNIFHGLHGLKILYLGGNRLATLPVNTFHGLTALEELYLDDNQFSTLSANIFNGLTELGFLNLTNNPISLTQSQLAKELQLPRNTELVFKNSGQEKIEQELFAAIRKADASEVHQLLNYIMSGMIGGFHFPIHIWKIRDAKGDNLVHAAIRDVAERSKVIDGMSVGLPEDEKKAVKEVQAEQKTEINDRYMKIISEILSCGEECVQDMLFTPNAEGQQVIDAVIAKLGFDSPIYKAILKGLTPEESLEAKAVEDIKENENQNKSPEN